MFRLDLTHDRAAAAEHHCAGSRAGAQQPGHKLPISNQYAAASWGNHMLRLALLGARGRSCIHEVDAPRRAPS